MNSGADAASQFRVSRNLRTAYSPLPPHTTEISSTTTFENNMDGVATNATASSSKLRSPGNNNHVGNTTTGGGGSGGRQSLSTTAQMTRMLRLQRSYFAQTATARRKLYGSIISSSPTAGMMGEEGGELQHHPSHHHHHHTGMTPTDDDEDNLLTRSDISSSFSSSVQRHHHQHQHPHKRAIVDASLLDTDITNVSTAPTEDDENGEDGRREDQTTNRPVYDNLAPVSGIKGVGSPASTKRGKTHTPTEENHRAGGQQHPPSKYILQAMETATLDLWKNGAADLCQKHLLILDALSQKHHIIRAIFKEIDVGVSISSDSTTTTIPLTSAAAFVQRKLFMTPKITSSSSPPTVQVPPTSNQRLPPSLDETQSPDNIHKPHSSSRKTKVRCSQEVTNNAAGGLSQGNEQITNIVLDVFRCASGALQQHSSTPLSKSITDTKTIASAVHEFYHGVAATGLIAWHRRCLHVMNLKEKKRMAVTSESTTNEGSDQPQPQPPSLEDSVRSITTLQTPPLVPATTTTVTKLTVTSSAETKEESTNIEEEDGEGLELPPTSTPKTVSPVVVAAGGIMKSIPSLPDDDDSILYTVTNYRCRWDSSTSGTSSSSVGGGVGLRQLPQIKYIILWGRRSHIGRGIEPLPEDDEEEKRIAPRVEALNIEDIHNVVVRSSSEGVGSSKTSTSPASPPPPPLTGFGNNGPHSAVPPHTTTTTPSSTTHHLNAVNITITEGSIMGVSMVASPIDLSGNGVMSDNNEILNGSDITTTTHQRSKNGQHHVDSKSSKKQRQQLRLEDSGNHLNPATSAAAAIKNRRSRRKQKVPVQSSNVPINTGHRQKLEEIPPKTRINHGKDGYVDNNVLAGRTDSNVSFIVASSPESSSSIPSTPAVTTLPSKQHPNTHHNMGGGSSATTSFHLAPTSDETDDVDEPGGVVPSAAPSFRVEDSDADEPARPVPSAAPSFRVEDSDADEPARPVPSAAPSFRVEDSDADEPARPVPSAAPSFRVEDSDADEPARPVPSAAPSFRVEDSDADEPARPVPSAAPSFRVEDSDADEPARPVPSAAPSFRIEDDTLQDDDISANISTLSSAIASDRGDDVTVQIVESSGDVAAEVPPLVMSAAPSFRVESDTMTPHDSYPDLSTPSYSYASMSSDFLN